MAGPLLYQSQPKWQVFAALGAGALDVVATPVQGNDAGVTGMRVKSVLDGSTREIPLHGFFVAIGHSPNTQLFDGQLAMKNGYLTITTGLEGNATQTSVAWPRWMPRSSSTTPTDDPGAHPSRAVGGSRR